MLICPMKKSSLTKAWHITDPSTILAPLFGTTLAPIAGEFGWRYGVLISVVPSIGISLYPTDGHTLETLINKAHKAMYIAKEFEYLKYQFYDALIIDTLANTLKY